LIIANLNLNPDPDSINMNPKHWFIPDSLSQTDDAIDLTSSSLSELDLKAAKTEVERLKTEKSGALAEVAGLKHQAGVLEAELKARMLILHNL
jgi:hypothetical protein